jgi:O-antigen/teichoic acid export membrane protein
MAASAFRPDDAVPARRGDTARSMLWSLLESGGLTATSLLTLVVFAHLLSPAELGSAAMALSLVQILALPVEVLFQDALVQRREAGARHFDTAFTVSFSTSLVLFALCWFTAEPIAAMVGDPQLAMVLGWAGLCLPASGVATALIARQRREYRFRELALRSLIGRIGGAVIAVALALLGAGVWAPVAQQVLSVVLATAMLWLTVSVRPRFGFGIEEFRGLFSFGIRALGTNAFVVVLPRVFLLQVGAVLGSDAAGHVNLAFRTVDMLRDVGAASIWRLALPVFAGVANRPRVLRIAFSDSLTLACALAFPAFAGLAAVAPEVISVVYGSQWVPATPFVVALCGVAMLFFVRLYIWAALTALGHPHYPVAGLLLESVVVLAWPLAGTVSAEVAIGAWVLRAVLAAPVDVWMLRRAGGLSVRDQLRGLPSLLVLAAAMAAAVAVLDTALPPNAPEALSLAIRVASGIAVYVSLLFLVRRGLARRVLVLGAAMVPR